MVTQNRYGQYFRLTNEETEAERGSISGSRAPAWRGLELRWQPGGFTPQPCQQDKGGTERGPVASAQRSVRLLNAESVFGAFVCFDRSD